MARLPESITVFVENIPKVADALQKAEWLRLAAEDVVLQRGRSREAGMAVTSAKAMDRLADALRAIEEPAAGVRVTGEAGLREAAQAILDRCLDVFDPDDLDPESSFAMPVTLKARWVYALRAALVSEEKL